MSTGCDVRPEEVEGLAEGWDKISTDIIVIMTAMHWKGLGTVYGGKLVVNIAEMPIKCPVAPLGIRLPCRLVFP